MRLVAVFEDCPQFAERGYTSFFKPFYVQGHLDERIRAHPPVTFSRTTRQFHSIPFDPELDQHSPPHTRDFPVLPEAETNSAAYPTIQVPGVLVEEADLVPRSLRRHSLSEANKTVVEPSHTILAQFHKTLVHGDAATAGGYISDTLFESPFGGGRQDDSLAENVEAEKGALFEWSDPALFFVDQNTFFRHATSGFTSIAELRASLCCASSPAMSAL